jgi:phosphatidylserine decarboxylase
VSTSNGESRLRPHIDIDSLFRMVTIKSVRSRVFASHAQSLRCNSVPRSLQNISRPWGLRPFSTSVRLSRKNQEYKNSFNTRLRKALADTKIKWYPIPVALGIAFLGLAQLYRINERERARLRNEEREDEEEPTGRPKRRERIRPTGPWFVVRTFVL